MDKDYLLLKRAALSRPSPANGAPLRRIIPT
jgi:hypothetical protein